MKTQKRKHEDTRRWRYHHSRAAYFTSSVCFFYRPSAHSVDFSLKLKPLYKELLYTIAHKMGNPSSTEVFPDSRLHQYIKEVDASASHITPPITPLLCRCVTDCRDCCFLSLSLCPAYQAFTMTESEHNSLMEKVQNTEVRKGSQHVCSNECAFRDS